MLDDGYEIACERIAEIAMDALANKLDSDAALVAIQTIATSAPRDPGEDWFRDHPKLSTKERAE